MLKALQHHLNFSIIFSFNEFQLLPLAFYLCGSFKIPTNLKMEQECSLVEAPFAVRIDGDCSPKER